MTFLTLLMIKIQLKEVVVLYFPVKNKNKQIM